MRRKGAFSSAGGWFAAIGVIVIVGAVAAWSVVGGKGYTQAQVTLKAIPASAVHHAWQRPHIRNKNGTSTNWAGYAVFGSGRSTFGDAAGSWIVPAVTASTSRYTYSSSWVGIDGYNDNTVEQIGTEQDWSNGAPVYYAWFEMYPQAGYELVGFPVKPGETISAGVQYVASTGRFKLSIINATEKVNYSITQRARSAQRLSAEWIQEAPWSGGVLPLAKFKTINFFACSATMNGHTGTISDSSWQRDPLTMQTSGGVVKAAPSALAPGGAAFSVTWHHE